MRKKIIYLTLIMAFLLVSSAFAQVSDKDIVELVRAETATARKLVISANIDFTEEEGELFWPIYKKYRFSIGEVGDRLLTLIKKYAENYKTLNDEVASELMIEYLDIEEDKLLLKRMYTLKLLDVLPPRKVAQFFQLENKMDAEVMMEMSLSIPLIKPQENAQK